jgi:hypothetical protein
MLECVSRGGTDRQILSFGRDKKPSVQNQGSGMCFRVGNTWLGLPQ